MAQEAASLATLPALCKSQDTLLNSEHVQLGSQQHSCNLMSSCSLSAILIQLLLLQAAVWQMFTNVFLLNIFIFYSCFSLYSFVDISCLIPPPLAVVLTPGFCLGLIGTYIQQK